MILGCVEWRSTIDQVATDAIGSIRDLLSRKLNA